MPRHTSVQAGEGRRERGAPRLVDQAPERAHPLAVELGPVEVEQVAAGRAGRHLPEHQEQRVVPSCAPDCVNGNV